MAEESGTRCAAPDCKRRKKVGNYCPDHAFDPKATSRSQLRTRQRVRTREMAKDARIRDRRAKAQADRVENQLKRDMEVAAEGIRVALESLGLPEDVIEEQTEIALVEMVELRIETSRRSLTRADADPGGGI